VGKTTIAVNLAVYIRALREDLPILFLSLDDQSLPDRMFMLDADPQGETFVEGMAKGSFASAIRAGQYGIHHVPSDPQVARLKQVLESPWQLRSALDRTGFKGLVVIDTKSDLEILTENAIAASDLITVIVADQESLLEADKLFTLLGKLRRPRDCARIVLSLVDLRIRYREGESRDILAHLVSEIRARGYPLLTSYISRSPKIQGLYTNPFGRVMPILHGAPSSLIHKQMHVLAQDVIAALEEDEPGRTSLLQTEPVISANSLAPRGSNALPASAILPRSSRAPPKRRPLGC
jgi:cellulose biosynthesis protein BcsQ